MGVTITVDIKLGCNYNCGYKVLLLGHEINILKDCGIGQTPLEWLRPLWNGSDPPGKKSKKINTIKT